MATKIGLVGGVGWPGTVIYYQGLCRAGGSEGGQNSPPMTIESLEMAKTMAARGRPDDERSWEQFDRIFCDAIERLAVAGCDLAAMATVTPHVRLQSISANARIPVVGITDAVEASLKATGASHVLVLGTSVTMSGSLFDAGLARCGAQKVETPPAVIGNFTDLLDRYFYPGHGRQGRAALLELLPGLVPDPGNTIVLLGCTDLAPAFPEASEDPYFEVGGFRFLDATSVHVSAIMEAADKA